MSLTSYRAAPPRVKHLLCLRLNPGDDRLRPALFAWLVSSVPKASLEGNPGAKARRVRGVCIKAGWLWKGLRERFFRLYDRASDRFPLYSPRSCQKFHKEPACGNKMRAERALEGGTPWTNP